MRTLTLLLFLTLNVVLRAQYALPVAWKTTDGETGVGMLERLPRHLDLADRLVIRSGYDRPRELLPREIAWLVHQRDTVLLRKTVDGQSSLWRLLYQGEVKLYRMVRDEAHRRYYLVRGHRWQKLSALGGEQAGYAILRRNCQGFKPSARIKHDHRAVQLVAQLNDCLGVVHHYPLPTYRVPRHQLGVLYNHVQKSAPLSNDRVTTFSRLCLTYGSTC